MDRILFPNDRRVALPDVPQIPHQIVVEAETFGSNILLLSTVKDGTDAP